MNYLMSKFNSDIWIKIIDFLELTDGCQLLLVNKYFSSLFFNQNRKKIFNQFVQNMRWSHGHGLIQHGIWDISITMLSSYLCVFCKMVNDNSSMIEELAKVMDLSLRKELSCYDLAWWMSTISVTGIIIEVRWHIPEATENRRERLRGFEECKAILKKCDEMLFCNSHKYFEEKNTQVELVMVTNMMVTPGTHPKYKWSFQRRRGITEYREQAAEI